MEALVGTGHGESSAIPGSLAGPTASLSLQEEPDTCPGAQQGLGKELAVISKGTLRLEIRWSISCGNRLVPGLGCHLPCCSLLAVGRDGKRKAPET